MDDETLRYYERRKMLSIIGGKAVKAWGYYVSLPERYVKSKEGY